MAKIIKFEDDDGVKYETPVIEDTGGVYRRPSVIHGDEGYKDPYGRRTPGGFTKNTKHKPNSVNT